MKKAIRLLVMSLLLSIQIQAQINANPDPDGPVWITGDCLSAVDRLFEDIPVLHLSDTSMNTQLPSQVRNDTSRFFPPIFSQGYISCCTFASEVGYIFTYEMNRIRNAVAGEAWSLGQDFDTLDLQNLYHPLFCYNYVNQGDYNRFTYQTDGFKLLKSVGCPMYNRYYSDVFERNYSISTKEQDSLRALF